MRFPFKLLTVLAGCMFGVFAPLEVYAQQRQAQTQDTTLITVKPDSTYDDRSLVGPRGSAGMSGFSVQRSGLVQVKGTNEKVVITYTEDGTYLLQQTINGVPVGEPVELTFDEYRLVQFRNSLKSNWAKLVRQSNLKNRDASGLLDFEIQVPGGRESVFTTIFGKPSVNLRVTGTANMNIGASIQRTEDPAIPEDQRKRIDPLFNQNLKLNIQGSIGDKLTINTDWDTERPFDYENRLRIVYQGYDDEIIKTIELGNVSMDNNNSLISGGRALFGIKSVAKMGDLTISSVVSQQEGESKSKTLDGGAVTEQFNVRPADYENDRHFYMGKYALTNYEEALSNPVLPINLFNFSEIKVFKLNISTSNLNDPQEAVAFSDLGVSETKAGEFLPPNEETDVLDDTILDEIRNSNQDTIDVALLADRLGVDGRNIVRGYWIELQPGVDYEVDQGLGTLSLKSSLQSREALAVTFKYNIGGENRTVGDSDNVGGVKILKLLRQPNVQPDYDTWNLTMRNIYSLGQANLSSDNLELRVMYTGGTSAQPRIPGLNETLLQGLGLDRVNQNQEPTPDNQADFSTGVIDGAKGLVRFPYVRPFGERVAEIIEASDLPDKETLIGNLAFTELYNESQGNARVNSKQNSYSISGESTGGISESYSLGIGLVEGSVKVFANGVELTEGVDFEVDYAFGSIYITNRKYLAQGQEIEIEYESNQLLQIQQTTFLGLNANYQLTEDITLGASYVQLTDKPISDKIRVGDEPIDNSMIGLNARGQFDAPWLTRFIDSVPLLETKAPSNIKFSGEYAQLRPGVAQTNAVKDAIDRGVLYKDEKSGLAFIDDFEGAETSFGFKTPGRWSLASAPQALPGYDIDLNSPDRSINARIEKSDRRAQFSWYSVPVNISSILGLKRTFETRQLLIQDIFDREVLTQENTLQTMDIYFNPQKRGQYNYNPDLKDLLENRPEQTWGGMTTVLPQGLEDLTLSNIEFIEFWFQPIVPKEYNDDRSLNGPQSLREDYDGKMYIDLGVVSEDVVPNSTSNNEDGLAQGGTQNLVPDAYDRSYVLNRPVDFDGQFSINSIEEEDVGLDGIPSTGGFEGKNEQEFYRDFIVQMGEVYGTDSPEYEAIAEDPSNDDYFYYSESQLNDLSIQERFFRLYGYTEANSRTTGEKRAITNKPDGEGLVIATVPEYRSSYFEYEFEVNPAHQSELEVNNYITDVVVEPANDRNGGVESKWYQVRIPLSDWKRKVGDINDFQSISHIRLWMTGYKKPFTMRFASFELVGSQWRKAEEVGELSTPSTDFLVSTINVEENRNREPVPYYPPKGAIRAQNRTQQGNLLANEQSLSLSVRDLRRGDIKMVKRTFDGPSKLNMVNYSNVRMFVHGEGYDRRKDMQLVIRMGRDLEDNFYEYRQPVTPSDSAFFDGLPVELNRALEDELKNEIWLTEENSVNMVLDNFNSLKQLRNFEGIDPTALYQDSTLVEDAPQGTIIGIKGNPSLSDIYVIGIGIANPAQLGAEGNPAGNVGAISLDADVWVNEMRVSGFRNKKAWAAKSSVGVKFADVANLNLNYSRQTDGFGGLNSKLQNRSTDDRDNIGVSSSFNLHKFIPDRYGWNMPVSFSYSRSMSTPRYLPGPGDIRLSDFEDAILASGRPEAEKDSIISSTTRQAETYREDYSLNLSNFSKRYSESNWLKYTIDNSSFSYVYNEGSSRSPTTVYNNNWNYSTSYNYRLSIRKVELLQPFSWLEDVPVLDAVSGLQFGYVPSSMNYSANLDRNYNEVLERSVNTGETDFRQTKSFGFRQSFNLSYNFTPNIPINFSSSSNFNLDDVGYVEDPQDSTRFEVVPTFEALDNLISVDSISGRKSNYTESYGASWRPRFNKVKWLDWFTYSIAYSGGFRWANSPKGSGLGANLSNNFSLDQSGSFEMQKILGVIPYYDELKEVDKKSTAERKKLDQQIEKDRERLDRLIEQQKKDTTGENKQQDAINKIEEQIQESTSQLTLKDNVMHFGRKMLLGGLSMQKLDVSYNFSEDGSQNGYSGGSNFIDMFNSPDDGSFSPNFGYRIGLNRRLTDLVANPNENQTLRINQNTNFSDNISIKTRFTPIDNLSVDLNWQIAWQQTDSRTLELAPNSSDVDSRLFSSQGNLQTNTWAFGSGYRELYERQLQRGLNDITDSDQNTISDNTGNQDGNTILDKDGLNSDLQSAYLGYNGVGFGKQNYMPLPLPNWKVTWSGLEKTIPYADDYASRVSLSHGYQGNYRVGWVLNNDAGEITTGRVGVGGNTYAIEYEVPRYEPTQTTIQHKFVPVVGLNITWKNNVTTSIQYDYSKISSISLSNPNVNERVSQGIKFSTNWSKRGFSLPFFKKLRNTLDLSLSVSYIEDASVNLNLVNDLSDAFINGYIPGGNVGDYPYESDRENSITGDSRLKVSTLIGYQFSRMIKANFEYTYDHLFPKSTKVFERVNQDIRFNIIVTIRSN